MILKQTITKITKMKRLILKPLLLLTLLLLFSCQETEVTNIVHSDGSITRKIVIKDTDGGNFKPEFYKVPFDSTWKISDTIEIAENNDTTWIRTAEKFFRDVDELNLEYKNDKGANRQTSREARFSKKFHWFNTIYTFSEDIESNFKHGYPIEDYLSEKELEYFYLPENILEERKMGSDSINARQIADSVELKSEKWMFMSCIAEWEYIFQSIAEKNGKWNDSLEFLKAQDSLIYSLIEKAENDSGSNYFFDSKDIILRKIFGDELFVTLKPEIDSSMVKFEELFAVVTDFSEYSVRTIMPGKLVCTKGFIDTNGEILWPVKMEYFLTQPYHMWAESKTSNTWAWVVSGVFLGFVFLGLIVRFFKK